MDGIYIDTELITFAEKLDADIEDYCTNAMYQVLAVSLCICALFVACDL